MDELFAPTHLLLLLIIALLVFGPRRLPELGGGLGRAIGSFKRAMAGEDEDGSAGAGKDGKDGEDGEDGKARDAGKDGKDGKGS